MDCPYCKQQMQPGHMHAPSDYAIYWLHEMSTIEGMLLTEKKVQACKGVVIDTVSKVGFIAKEKPQTFYCKHCNIFITKK